MRSTKQNRREFLEKVTLGIAGASAAISGNVLAATAAVASGEMPYRTLGRSGEKVSLLGLAGFTSASSATSRKAFASSARPSTTA